MIVDWGDADNCPEALNIPSTTNFSTVRDRSRDEIPYVVDFCYGYASNVDQTGWLQDPRPRPFYTSGANIDITDSGSQVDIDNLDVATLEDYRDRLRGTFLPFLLDGSFGAGWQFFHLADTLNIDTNRIDTSDCW